MGDKNNIIIRLVAMTKKAVRDDAPGGGGASN
jgi:hypothetical protein